MFFFARVIVGGVVQITVRISGFIADVNQSCVPCDIDRERLRREKAVSGISRKGTPNRHELIAVLT